VHTNTSKQLKTLTALYFHSVSVTDNYVQCPCNNFIKRHFNQYFVNNNSNNNNLK